MNTNYYILISCLSLLILLYGCSNSYSLTITLDDSTGLEEGSEVIYLGKKIGVVSETIKENGTSNVIIMVDKSIKIPEGSSFHSKVYNIVGQRQIEIIPSKSKTPITPGTKVKGKDISTIKL